MGCVPAGSKVEGLKDFPEDLLLVGHLPHVSKLTSPFLCNNPNKNIISFKMVGVMCLERDESKAWSVQWMLISDLVLEERTGVVCNGLQSS
jgi:phosphohistidine phosphatase